jgi:hypothetical protein
LAFAPERCGKAKHLTGGEEELLKAPVIFFRIPGVVKLFAMEFHGGFANS